MGVVVDQYSTKNIQSDKVAIFGYRGPHGSIGTNQNHPSDIHRMVIKLDFQCEGDTHFMETDWFACRLPAEALPRVVSCEEKPEEQERVPKAYEPNNGKYWSEPMEKKFVNAFELVLGKQLEDYPHSDQYTYLCYRWGDAEPPRVEDLELGQYPDKLDSLQKASFFRSFLVEPWVGLNEQNVAIEEKLSELAWHDLISYPSLATIYNETKFDFHVTFLQCIGGGSLYDAMVEALFFSCEEESDYLSLGKDAEIDPDYKDRIQKIESEELRAHIGYFFSYEEEGYCCNDNDPILVDHLKKLDGFSLIKGWDEVYGNVAFAVYQVDLSKAGKYFKVSK